MSDNATPQADTTSGVDPGLAKDGKVSYLQIPAADIARSAAFYTGVFGWSDRDDGNPMHRSFSDTSGGLIGAWVTNRPIAPDGGVLPYIYVDRIDDAIRRLEAAGGSVVEQPYPEGDLWVATFRDPAGNVIGLWQAGPR